MQDQYTSKVFDIDYTPSRKKMREARVMSEAEVLDQLKLSEKTDVYQRIDFQKKTSNLIKDLRTSNQPDLLSLFISEYNLTSDEGLSLMTLVEAFLRVPDNKTRDKLFIDKVARKGWTRHIGGSKSSMVNIATIALSIADRMIAHGSNKEIKNRIKKALEILSRPGIRFSANNVMQFFAKQFVYAENIKTAIKSSKAKNGLYSFDMLGEAAWTMADADKYFLSYKNALIEIGKHRQSKNVFEADGISVKLSALHPKYDFMHRERVLSELLPRIIELVIIAQKYNIGINIDAEEAERLDLSLDVIDRIMGSIANTSWQGFGVVVQAYQKRSPYVIDWLHQSCKKYDLKIMVRLVKGAYWDSEIKKAQVMGEVDYPVFTKKINTDYSFLVCAQKLLLMRNFIYPQFASHNAHSLVSVCEIAGDNVGFEVQRLHGMGESLHIHIKNKYDVLSRVYAPIGSHKELLAYLMRRLLENGANSSFINHLFDENIKPESLAIDVFSEVEKDTNNTHSKIPLPKDIFKDTRKNSSSIMLTEQNEVDLLFQSQEPWLRKKWQAKSMISGIVLEDSKQEEVKNPSDTADIVGSLLYANDSQLDHCLISAQNVFNLNSHEPGRILESLNRAAELYEENQFELMALAMREAGKTYQDAIDEVREAVDFLRYYSNLARKVLLNKRKAMGVFVCISPWNFPLAIFTGQVAAALASGNVVIAKPAESTSLIAYRASELLIEAGIPLGVFQLCLGKGSDVGSYLTSSSIISGVAFTGSSAVAKKIKHNLVKNGNPEARVIAETGGLNAMVVDSTALCEQVTRDVIDGAFKSAGQRCSALRILMIQEECFDETLKMIQGAMMELRIGNSKHLSTDCGPVINHDAQVKLQGYIEKCRKRNQIIGEIQCDLQTGYYVTPTIINLKSIDEINEEFFGPILHVISYKSNELESMIDQLNAKGFGLTFGIHSRIDKQVEEITSRVNAGNVYVNRNQIGAVVGSQPFGGEGLSGTGPKAGGPSSLHGYSQSISSTSATDYKLTLYGNTEINNLKMPSLSLSKDLISKMQNNFSFIESDFFDFLHDEIAKYTTKIALPGPTGESNSIRYKPKGTVLCLGPTAIDALKQTLLSLALGSSVISLIQEDEYNSLIALGFGKENIYRLVNGPSLRLMKSESYKVILFFGNLMSVEKLIVNRHSAITPVMSSLYETWQLFNERVITEDTTASGGNANLLAL
ncbi:bifunctional proline dehydrogenase/L-glutamate gamma-semialdehyde dehydrogenase PutA [Candidatus Thioglobus sp.]|nr:bifunctional proline dehydrogenase/L-glutamate gamma-semialdehyde dehydrogenase PutA [Candidatus Thioglobus sp.]